jgi:hypothetical protein
MRTTNTTTTFNTTNNRSSAMITVRPFIGQTDSGFPFQGYACIINGYWGTRSNGYHIWAMSEGKAHELGRKVAGQVGTTPATFIEWGVLPTRGAAPAPRPAPQAAPGPFATATPAARPAPVEAPRTVTVQAQAPRPRSAAQCAATLRLTSSNALRCERGDIGGDIGKMRKGVLTAMANYQEACKREGVGEDRELLENAVYAAGVDAIDSEAV